ncbi:phospho-N-acetylmuramoyl-pentapeptide-transferase [Angelakisella massiliensis]|uniref:phospho-N-acetylmuramoyl-pentapeptide- transferase n=1 Tax=Angelakisella massiliensis TaxID=1871018 RepID=UPI0008F80FAA|nr:phospho-N-acetylmuramoyl-pentapeptide-transferase [Angelakisella massiliensis]
MDGLWIISAVVISFGITAISGIWLLPILRKLKFGQTILDIGPKWHKNKQGTPTMGGLMFIIGVTVSVVVSYMLLRFNSPLGERPDSPMIKARLLYGLMLAIAFGLIGFADDYIKIIRKHNEGLTPRQKLLLQTMFGIIYLLLLYISGSRSTVLTFPFLGSIDIGILYYPFALFAILALSNAVNFTDGLDGLLSSVTFVVGIAYMIITSILQMWEMGIMAAAMAGGCLGFLIWNFYPAKVFMGDTGSLFLGGLIIALAFGTGLPVYIVLIGLIYVVEAASVVIQMTYFKLTHGKRIFKMSPIHHHFELCGYSEVQIVVAFTLVTAVASVLAIWAVRLL